MSLPNAEAAEAAALAPSLAPPPLNLLTDPRHSEGSYLAALKGGHSSTWKQKQETLTYMPTSGPVPKPQPPPLLAAAAATRPRRAHASSTGTPATGRETAPSPDRQVTAEEVVEAVPLAGSAVVAAVVMLMRSWRWRIRLAPAVPELPRAHVQHAQEPGPQVLQTTGASCGTMEVATSLSGAMLHLHFSRSCNACSNTVFQSDTWLADMLCPCDAGTCLILTSKAGKNFGRQFYHRPVNQGVSSRGFFKWCDAHQLV